MWAGVLVAMLIWLPFRDEWKAVLCGVGGDRGRRRARRHLRPAARGQARPGRSARRGSSPSRRRSTTSRCRSSSASTSATRWRSPRRSSASSLIMNAVNFSDGVDGLAAGVCAIAGAGLRVHRLRHQGRNSGTAHLAGVLSAIVAGAALGFLVWNFFPARTFMGDSGSNLLGLLLGSVADPRVGQDVGHRRPDRAAGDPRRAVPRHHVRGSQADEVPAARSTRPTPTTSTTASAESASASGARCSTSTPGRWCWPASRWRCASCPTPTATATSTPAGRSSWRRSCSLALAASVYLVYLLEILKLRRRFRRETSEEVQHRLETGEFGEIELP